MGRLKVFAGSWVLRILESLSFADRGNVRVGCIEGTVVKLELQGSCESCSSSTVTMTMGLERHLKFRIPEISDVVQILPVARSVTPDAVEEVLSEIRPFLSLTGGSIVLKNVVVDDNRRASIALHVDGLTAALQSVKLEIIYRLRKLFGANIEVLWN